jgi:outer membrane biosynthesis protein TonB
MKNLILFMAVLSLCFPAAAQIRVVNPDGSVTEFNPSDAAPPPPPPPAAPPEKIEWIKPEPKAKAEAPVAKPESAPAPAKKPVAKPAKSTKSKPKKPSAKPKPKPVQNVIVPPEYTETIIREKGKWRIAPGQPVTDANAFELALKVAPPSRGYTIERVRYKDRPVVWITFKTEQGPHDIVVDAETGTLMN